MKTRDRNPLATLFGLWVVSTTLLVGMGAVSTPIGVRGPTSSTDEALIRWDGTGGTNAQNSGWTLNDSNLMTAGGNYALGANYISRAGTAAGLSFDASNNATLSGTLATGGTITAGGNYSIGANYISRAGTAAGLSFDASNNATLSASLNVGTVAPASGTLNVNSGGANTYVAMAGPASTGKSLIQWNGVTTTNICGLEWARSGSFSSRLRYDGTTGDLVWFNTTSGSEVEKWRLSLNGNMTVSGTFVTENVTLGSAVNTTAHAIKSSTYNGTAIDAIKLQTFTATGSDIVDRVVVTAAASGTGAPGLALVKITDADLVVKKTFNLDAVGTQLTISSGAITVTKSYHKVEVETGSTDDLDTINGGTEGDLLVLRANDTTKDIVVKDGTGNIQCAGDFTLDSVQDTITLIFDGTNWLETARSNNGA